MKMDKFKVKDICVWAQNARVRPDSTNTFGCRVWTNVVECAKSQIGVTFLISAEANKKEAPSVVIGLQILEVGGRGGSSDED